MRKVDRVVAFGDSFIFGDELAPAHQAFEPAGLEYAKKHCAAGQLATMLGATKFENYALPGNSLEGIQWTFMDWMLQNKQTVNAETTLFIVGLTHPRRQAFWDAEVKHGAPYYSQRPSLSFVTDVMIRNDMNHTLYRMLKEHINHSESIEYARLKGFTIPHSIYAYCKMYNYRILITNPVLELNVFTPIDGVPADCMEDINSWMRTQPDFCHGWYAPKGHWSIEGSHAVAKHWLDLIHIHNI